MHSTHPQLWHSFQFLPHRCLQVYEHSGHLDSRLCSSCGELPQSQSHCIGDKIDKNTDFKFTYLIPIQNVGLREKYNCLVTGSVVALKAQATNSSNSAWSEKIGAWALLYF